MNTKISLSLAGLLSLGLGGCYYGSDYYGQSTVGYGNGMITETVSSNYAYRGALPISSSVSVSTPNVGISFYSPGPYIRRGYYYPPYYNHPSHHRPPNYRPPHNRPPNYRPPDRPTVCRGNNCSGPSARPSKPSTYRPDDNRPTRIRR